MDAECEDVFSDEIGLSECFTAHSGTAGAQVLAENACRGRCSPAQSRHIPGQHGRLLEWQLEVIRAWRIPSSVLRAIQQHGSGRSGCGRPENVVLQRGGQVTGSCGSRKKCTGARCCFSNVQEWSARQCKHETGASFVGPDVRSWRAWLVCFEFLCLCAIFVCVCKFLCVCRAVVCMLRCCVCGKHAVL